ncbi:retrotransposon protein, putative, ty1-copia subclass [Tanacetum coccineum]
MDSRYRIRPHPNPYDVVLTVCFQTRTLSIQTKVVKARMSGTLLVMKVAAYVIQMKGYVDQLERLGYVLPQEIIVGLILNGLTKDFSGFVRNYNMHNMGKTVGELHAMLIEYGKDYALESLQHRILNMVPTKKVDKTPYELWYGKVPNLSYLKVWGCEALVKRDTPNKLQQRSVKCIFIGYPKETMGYYFYFPPENKIVVARYAEFFEKNLITQEVSGRAMDLEEIQDEDTSPSEITSEIPMEVEEAEEHSLGDLNEPTSYKAAMLDSESNMWIDAMNAEIQSMMDNMVWVLVDLPPGCKTVETKGYTQLYGVDYEETFSPVADIRAIRILISIAAYYDYEIWQMDIKTAFLNGYLDEDIYMVQPEGFVDPNHPRKVCKLQRSIYGLKQASRSWNKRFDEEIKRFGFAQNLDEPCVYQKASGSNVTFLILYVDDIIIMGNHIPSLQSVKDYLGKCFAMKDLGEAAFILGIKIYKDRSKRLIGLGQNAYMDKILKRYKMDNSKRVALEAEMEVVWIRKFISGLGIVLTINEPIKMFCDNSAALLFANEPGVLMGARHYHRSNLLKVHTDNNLAYIFTKALPKGKLTQHARKACDHQDYLHEWNFEESPLQGFTAALAVLITGASQNKQHGKSEPVIKRLSECKALESNGRRIQVKDIVKEVEDYLKTYSSAGMGSLAVCEGLRE